MPRMCSDTASDFGFGRELLIETFLHRIKQNLNWLLMVLAFTSFNIKLKLRITPALRYEGDNEKYRKF